MPSTGDRPKWNTVKYESQIKVWFTARAPAILYLRESGGKSVWLNQAFSPTLHAVLLYDLYETGLHGQSFLYSPHLVYMARAFFTAIILSTWPEVFYSPHSSTWPEGFLQSSLVYLARGFFTVLIGLLGQRVFYSPHWSTWPEGSLQSSLVYLARGFFTVLIGLLGQRVLYSPHWSTWLEVCFFTVLIGLLGQSCVFLQSSLVYLARVVFFYSPHWSTWPEGSLQSSSGLVVLFSTALVIQRRVDPVVYNAAGTVKHC